MNNETVISILDYADTHHNFSIEDLFAFLQKNWHKQVFLVMVSVQASE